MGRPIKKSRMSGGSSIFGSADLAGSLAVTAYRPYGGSKVDSVVAYVISQRSSNKFKIHLEDSSESVYQLKAVAPGSLSATNSSSLGEFCVQVILNDSTVAYVEKFYNRTIHYVTAGGAAGTATYTLGAEGTDEGQAGAGGGSIDVR